MTITSTLTKLRRWVSQLAKVYMTARARLTVFFLRFHVPHEQLASMCVLEAEMAHSTLIETCGRNEEIPHVRDGPDRSD